MALTDSIVSYWKLDGNSTDSAGPNNGTDTDISYVPAKINDGADFNGTSSKIGVGTNFQPTASGITVTAWINIADYANYQMVMAKRDAGSAEIFEFYVQLTSGKLSFYNGTAEFPGTAAVGTGSYKFVAMTLSAASNGELKFYINGSLDSTQSSISIGGGSSATPVFLGGYVDTGASEFFTGIMDEVGFWSRPLTGAEITELYNAGAGLQYPFTSGAKLFTLMGVGT